MDASHTRAGARAVRMLLIVTLSAGAGAVADRSTVERPYGGSFPTAAQNAEGGGVLALTVGEASPGLIRLLREKATGRPQTRDTEMLDRDELVHADTTTPAGLRSSIRDAAAAAATLIPQRRSLHIIVGDARSASPSEQLHISEIDGRRADAGTLQELSDTLLQAMLVDGPAALHGWQADVTFDDGRQSTMQADTYVGAGLTTAGRRENSTLVGESSHEQQGELHGVILRISPPGDNETPELRIHAGTLRTGHLLVPSGRDGSSAGLAYALTLIDHELNGDLLGGRRIAATGVIHPDGSIHPVSGVAAKSAAAAEAGAELLLVAAGSEEVAVIPSRRVQTLAEATNLLCEGAPTHQELTAAVCQTAAAQHQEQRAAALQQLR